MLDLGAWVGHDSFHMEPSERGREILDFERSWWSIPGTKKAAIRERLGISVTRYYRLLNDLIDDPAVVKYDPLVVKRLQRTRMRRRRARLVGRTPSAGPR